MGIVIICVLVVIFLLLWVIIDIVPQSEARVMERLGIFSAVWGAGIHLKFPIIDRCAVRVDLREQVMELPKVRNKGEGNTSDWGYNYTEKNRSKGVDTISNSKLGVGADADANIEGYGPAFSATGNILAQILGSIFSRRNSNKQKYSAYENSSYVDYENFSEYSYSDLQGVITKDNVVMHVDAAVFYQITDPKMYAYGMKQPKFALQKLTITTLRNIVGTLELDETLTSRELINSKLHLVLDEATDNWGIKITRVEIEEILPPPDIQGAMHRQATAERNRRAVILEAEGVAEANRLMNETAPNEAMIKMLAIQAMPKIANGQATKIIIPSEIQGLVGLANGITEGVTPSTKPFTNPLDVNTNN